MSRVRFWSDTSEASFLAGAASRGFEAEITAHMADVPDELLAHALDCGGTLVSDDDQTTTGVDGFLDTGAYSVRSDSAKMTAYEPPPITSVFYKKTERRKTRSQP